MAKPAVPPENPLLARVRKVTAGLLDVRVIRHPGMPRAVAVRSRQPVFAEAAARALEKAGLVVVRQPGWLEVTERKNGRRTPGIRSTAA